MKISQIIENMEGVMMNVINSKEMREKRIVEIQQEVSKLNTKPKLAIIQIGNNSASNSYIKNKINLGNKIGIDVELFKFENILLTSSVIDVVEELNADSSVNGIIVQLPLPSYIDENKVLNSILPSKDVDGLTMRQQGMLINGDNDTLYPCTAKGIVNMLKNITSLEGKDVVIINRSHLIGIPLQTMLMRENSTVMVCHSKTNDLKGKTQRADIIVTGIGKAKFFDKSYFRDGQIIIDCSMNMSDGKLVGDVDVEDVKNLDIHIASGTGQTGPYTVLSLIENTIEAYRSQSGER